MCIYIYVYIYIYEPQNLNNIYIYYKNLEPYCSRNFDFSKIFRNFGFFGKNVKNDVLDVYEFYQILSNFPKFSQMFPNCFPFFS